MTPESDRSGELWTLLSGLLVASGYLVWRTADVLRAPAAIRVGWITDDAYYYFALARRFSEAGEWSFDGGHSVTTGFHLLWGYGLAALHALFGLSDEGFVRGGIALSAALAIGALAWLGVATLRQRNRGAAFILAAMAFSPHFVINAFGCMEWSLAVLTSAVWLTVATSSLQRTSASRSVLVAVNAAAYLAVLSRSDLVLLVVVMVAVSAFRFRSEALIRAGGIGGILGATTVALHNLSITGVILSDSARVKNLWTESMPGWHPEYAARLGAELFAGNVLPSFGPLMLVGLGVAFGVFWAWSLRAKRDHAANASSSGPSAAGLVAAGCAAYLVVWTSLYALSVGGLFRWYSSMLVVPVACAGGWVLNRTARSRPASLCLWLTTVAVAGFGVAGWSHAPYDYAASAENLKAAKMLRGQSEIARVGSWNAGSLGYYSGGKVVNLDGLVNHEIYPYVRDNRLPEYLRERDIRLIIDRTYCVTQRFRHVIMGYDRPEFIASLKLEHDFSHGRIEGGAHLVLLKITD